MGKSNIEWTDATWNPWQGCTKVSAGCKNCYMYREKKMYGQNPTEVVRSKTVFDYPFRVKEPSKIFTCSWSDFFIEAADEWRDEAWEIIRKNPQHTFQILTKQVERIESCLPKDWGEGYENVWLGFSAEDQLTYDTRSYYFLELKAKVKFISFEPLLSKIHLLGDGYDLIRGFDWVIVGCESGPGKRECHLAWINKIINECRRVGVKVFVKQINLGGKVVKNIDEFPDWLQVREFPV